MLVTLRLYLSGGEERLLAQEIDDIPETPYEIVKRLSRDGRVPLGDRESCGLDSIERVELVPPPEPQVGPAWGPDYGLPDEVQLRDEDVATALSEGNQEPKTSSHRRSPSD
jgi:hypothetical protein